MPAKETGGAGRRREFDPSEKAAEAVDVFRTHGYRGTTTRHLETTLGVNQSSLYRVFRSKQELLGAALDHYGHFTEEVLLAPLRDGSSGLDDVRAYFDRLEAGIGCGCLLVALMGELSDEVDDVVARTAHYRRDISASIGAALDRAVTIGEIAASTAEARADLLMATVLGVNIAARGGADQAELTRLLDAARDELDNWRSTESS
ncbi:MAG: TetR/AcrR family transcriptional regulator [Acidimicrobiales bacterium]